MVVNKLFVYGSLCPGCPNEHILSDIGEGVWENASVTGVLHQNGWAAKIGYPAIVLDKNGDKVYGYVFICDNLATNWHKLDKFEGEEYKRELTTAELKNKVMVDTYIYTLKRGSD
ncbi:MAG: gamma-glutamylcyclotransferase [Gammaproteobacteria bacterium]|nr:MAG: gamma-glutamylcyclotransferase [Gammaproteobacteria bacterium]